MDSSTSSSRLSSRSTTARTIAYLCVCLAAGASSAVLIAVLVARGQVTGEWARRVEIPNRADAYFIYAGDNDQSHRVLLHGFGESLRNARAADVLILGDSRSQLGFREAFIDRFQARTGLKVFHMGMAGEYSRFALKLIEKHDLRPKLVIVTISDRFFNGELGRWGSSVVQENPWTARTAIWEATAQWHTARWLHRVVPRIDVREQTLWGPFVLYRSSRTGSWIPLVEPTDERPIEVLDEVQLVREEQRVVARAFKSELDRRGAALVLTVAPNNYANYAHAEAMAADLGVPLIAPRPEGLATTDRVHLAPESARRFAQGFWLEFVANPELRRRLSLGPPNPGRLRP